MTAPEPNGVPSRTKIVRRWANALTATTHVPLPTGELEHQLAGLLDVLLEALSSEPFTPDPAVGCGAALVDLHCTGRDSLRSTMDALGTGLATLPEAAGLSRRTERIVSTLGAMAAGYCEAIRASTLTQQDTVQRASLTALGDVHRKLRETTAELDHVLTGCPSGVALTTQDGRFARANAALGDILGYPAGEVTRISLFDVLPAEDADLYRSLLAGPPRQFERHQRLLRKDGDQAWAHLTMSTTPHGTCVTVLEDRTELKLLQSHVNHMALHDSLTGLPNRQFFSTRLETMLGRGVTVCHLDLDAFTSITRGLGRQVGDSVLTHVAQRLEAAVADQKAMVARFGADEFAVLVPYTPPETITGRIRDALRDPIAGITVTTCIGVVSTSTMTPAEVLDAAEMALAEARRAGRDQWAVFDAHKDAHDRDRLGQLASLSTAVRAGQINVTYQPLLRLEGKQIAGLDATLWWGRLNHADCAGPAQEWVLREICSVRRGLPVHIGLTTPDAQLIARVLDETERAPETLCVGVRARDLAAVSDLGVLVEIRDFGMDDLGCLGTVPVHAVRLARRLHDPGALTGQALRHVLELVHSAGADVIVDHVADWDQAERWQDLGADIAHGEFFTT
ncbi:diguanylate cyclase (GGDEF)-like protein/PAS domain S-box-containing protein [Kibdelosporangium banguiense]|uniref:Diguanylate cyclase (GGDEF)-like protein/PAS domain S-box-containing protein n=1 Tax=Kibdelosporangium banguiense TaxID=1365924 RepID=A0ABS4TIY6_9PSEU|nr:diguanylate cyclase [Kibdelosporangium banguiense]MBP2323975.1 diguanylate cyclase (GGDEF)-like protein/PAS domain S-box-containing protein [Kibdelosporangium banguiense]